MPLSKPSSFNDILLSLFKTSSPPSLQLSLAPLPPPPLPLSQLLSLNKNKDTDRGKRPDRTILQSDKISKHKPHLQWLKSLFFSDFIQSNCPVWLLINLIICGASRCPYCLYFLLDMHLTRHDIWSYHRQFQTWHDHYLDGTYDL